MIASEPPIDPSTPPNVAGPLIAICVPSGELTTPEPASTPSGPAGATGGIADGSVAAGGVEVLTAGSVGVTAAAAGGAENVS